MGPIFKRVYQLLVSGFFILVLSVPAAASAPSLPGEMRQLIQRGIKQVYLEQFDQAERTFGIIRKKWPSHPAGPFFEAVTLDARMYYYGNDYYEKDFFKLCDQAVQLGEKKVRGNPKDLWSKFFIGGAHGYKGTYESRYKRWISAFRNGFEGVSVFKEVQKASSQIVDVGMGIGTYDYWRSKLTKTLWWMPGVADRREEGIRTLYNTMKNGVYVKEASAQGLAWILIEEKRYPEALKISEQMLATYPNSRVFLWTKAKCLFMMSKWDASEKIYRYILDTMEASEHDNHYHAIKCRYQLGEIYYYKKIYYKALAECRRIQRYPISGKVREWSEEILGQTMKLLKMSARSYRKP